MTAIYFSGFPVEPCDTDARIPREDCWYRLGSCHRAYVKAAYRRSDLTVQQTQGNCELMFDSGAFTAWSKGEEVSYDTLCATYDDVLTRYVPHCKAVWLISLDKIPGSKGRSATKAELEEAVGVSNSNFDKMKQRFGAHVIPVFHQDESFAQLAHVVASADGYICVSPRNDVAEKHRVNWSVEVHRLLGPTVRTHGLAATGKRMLNAVPWHSVDSATWLFIGGNGGIITPQGQVIALSSKSPHLKDFDLHYETLPRVQQQQLEEYIVSCGFTVEELKDVSEARIIFNRIALMKIGRTVAPKHSTEMRLFDA